MRRLGATCISCVVAIAGFVAVGGAGYMTMTGKSLCSMVAACGDKSAEATKTVTTVANKEGGEKKSCCPLSKAQNVAAKEGGCSGEAAKVTNVAAKEAGECAKSCSGEAKVSTVAAKEGSCNKPCTGEAKVSTVAAKEGSCNKPCTGEAKVSTVAAKEGSCNKPCTGEAKATRFGTSVVMAGQTPVVMPAMFYNPAAKLEKVSLKENGGCSDEAKAACAANPATCCSAKGKVENASAKSDAGCCKGTGKRADGEPCKNDGDHCKDGAKAADKNAGTPIAARQ
jgi:hypothetical protein